ncbi:uncharacterized protein K02A2.6-like [Mercenaria mercenaria]|uniref:uncharacterized protein K02A2.6-like n=1 Tax=Mercenaria mercenaria TaxID=6596 RepID=UPI00234F5284|nr:uncharacterized protein K02A2.6-like [Mercenaria mercenaria]
MNLSDETQTFNEGTLIASASPVSKVTELKLNKVKLLLNIQFVPNLDHTQTKEVASLLNKYSCVFSKDDHEIGRTGIIKHNISTGNAQPVKQPFRRVPVHMNAEVDAQIKDMLERDVIQPSTSPWASGIVIVKKKDGTRRFCIDYRRLNVLSVKDAYPFPRIDDSLNQLAGNQLLSCLDLNSGYWQVEVDKNDIPKTAFTSRLSLFEFKVMPFGLCSAPATFERLMKIVLAGLQWQICLIYLDDVTVVGKTLLDAGLKLKPRKCVLFSKRVEFLGHIVSAEGVHTDPKKTETVRNWPIPGCVRDLGSFLGLCSYYRRFIFRFAEIAKPLHKLTEKGSKFEWSLECDKAFEELKQKLVEAPILAHPDFNQSFILDVDASDFAIAGILSQKIDGRTVLRYSHDIKASGHLGVKKTLNKIRQKYSWPGLQNDVKAYVNGCEVCLKRKRPMRIKKAPMQISSSGYPMERIAVDILGELPVTENGNKYILVVSDYFTKWTESYQMPNMEAVTVAKIMVKTHFDQGRQFVTKLFMEMCKLLQIEKTRTTPYHPESDGMVEKFNRTLCAMLRAYVDENHKNWGDQLPYVMMAYRACEHETTGVSPNKMMLGRETTTPLDLIYEMSSSIKRIPVNQWVWELQETFGNVQVIHADRMRKARDQILTGENMFDTDKDDMSAELNVPHETAETVDEEVENEVEPDLSIRGQTCLKVTEINVRRYVLSVKMK